ncbi:MAG: glycosyltransferase family 1 protein [Bacteroidota bacterium]|jgi:hypothetical protein
MKPLNIFYEEPDPDRWFKYDRYPRRLIRRMLRGKEKAGSIKMIALRLMEGLDLLKIPYRFNDYQYIKKHPNEIACIIGKPHLLDKHKWINPIIFGAGIFSHPIAYPDLLSRNPNIQKILVPGPWVKAMFTPYYGEDLVVSWPVGIDTEKWKPSISPKIVDFLVYSKFLWDKEQNTINFLNPLIHVLNQHKLSYEIITYGNYDHQSLKDSLNRCKSAIFLCEHESQGMAYQQILSSDVPILAWDREDFWLDPSFYPDKVRFKPSSSVPYWDENCGIKFKSLDDFEVQLLLFLNKLQKDAFSPRTYILEHLSLEICALNYFDIVKSIDENLTNR